MSPANGADVKLRRSGRVFTGPDHRSRVPLHHVSGMVFAKPELLVWVPVGIKPGLLDFVTSRLNATGRVQRVATIRSEKLDR